MTDQIRRTRRNELDAVMEFDQVVEVLPDRRVRPRRDMHAPQVWEENVIDVGWELLSGYTGQHGYRGPIMHDSEFIGGRIAEDILSRPGIYVAVASRYSDHSEDGFMEEGWAIAYRPAE